MLALHKESHVDHVPPQVVEHVLERFAGRDGFFVETFELPAQLPALENRLYGPFCGDAAVPESDVTYAAREGRAGASRLVDRPARATRTCSVIAGPHDGQPCVLFTAFGGPVSPKEPTDPTLTDAGRAASEAFWAEHALAR